MLVELEPRVGTPTDAYEKGERQYAPRSTMSFEQRAHLAGAGAEASAVLGSRVEVIVGVREKVGGGSICRVEAEGSGVEI